MTMVLRVHLGNTEVSETFADYKCTDIFSEIIHVL